MIMRTDKKFYHVKLYVSGSAKYVRSNTFSIFFCKKKKNQIVVTQMINHCLRFIYKSLPLKNSAQKKEKKRGKIFFL